jgi:hypothetical protein
MIKCKCGCGLYVVGDYLSSTPNPHPFAQWDEASKSAVHVHRGRLSSKDPITQTRAREDEEFRAEVTKKLHELDGGDVYQHVYADIYGTEAEVTQKIEIKCECGADAVQAAYHSAWCPKGTK